MNVLSLFDGMSCGQIALERAGIKVDNYFASEVDKYAIQIAKKNYPNIVHVGDINKLHYSDYRQCLTVERESNYIQDVPNSRKIDLIIGGSPCQSFSRSGDGSGFDGKSQLFFEFVRVLKQVKPRYFLLENVVMKKEWEDVITDILGVSPISINSKLLSAQNRPRLYWTNIPNVVVPEDKGIVIEDVISTTFSSEYPNYLDLKFGDKKRKSYVKNKNSKASCLTASMYKGQVSSFCKDDNGDIYKYTPQDCEVLQTVTNNYTEGVSNTQRYKMLGNGWTVDVIAHIFKSLNKLANNNNNH